MSETRDISPASSNEQRPQKVFARVISFIGNKLGIRETKPTINHDEEEISRLLEMAIGMIYGDTMQSGFKVTLKELAAGDYRHATEVHWVALRNREKETTFIARIKPEQFASTYDKDNKSQTLDLFVDEKNNAVNINNPDIPIEERRLRVHKAVYGYRNKQPRYKKESVSWQKFVKGQGQFVFSGPFQTDDAEERILFLNDILASTPDPEETIKLYQREDKFNREGPGFVSISWNKVSGFPALAEIPGDLNKD